MIQPFWKRALSYIYEFHIESAPSDYNPHLYVSLKDARYQLCTAKAIYSFEDKYDNFRDVFKKVDFDSVPGENVLVLGLGLASVPFMLEHTFKQKYQYTCVEIDESVVYLANKYAIPKITSPIDIICADAFNYINQTSSLFDLIIIDVFLDDITPEQFTTHHFLDLCKDTLVENGLIIYNCLGQFKDDKKASDLFYKNIFKPAFPKSTLIKTSGNYMLVSEKRYIK